MIQLIMNQVGLLHSVTETAHYLEDRAVTYNCYWCGKLVRVSPSVQKNHTPHFCNVKHQMEFRKAVYAQALRWVEEWRSVNVEFTGMDLVERTEIRLKPVGKEVNKRG